MSNVNQKIDKARMRLLRKSPFFGSLAFKLPIVATDRHPSGGFIATAGTDGARIYMNPEFTGTLSTAQTEMVLAHEILHVACKHSLRKRGRNHGIWNKACDYAINPILIEAGYEMPEGGLYNPAWGDGMAAETIYKELFKKGDDDGDTGGDDDADDEGDDEGDGPSGNHPSNEGDDEGDDEGDGVPSGGQAKPSDKEIEEKRKAFLGDVFDPCKEDGKALSEAEKQELERELDVEIVQAAQNEIMAKGDLPGNIRWVVEGVTKTKPQFWGDILEDVMKQIFPTSSTWNKPNRRHIASGTYLPSLQNESKGELVIAIDTSGSTESYLGMFEAKINEILEQVHVEKVHVIYVDSVFQWSDEYEPGDELQFKLHGGGGTNFRPAFRWVEDWLDEEPEALIYLTDLEAGRREYPDVEPDYPVFWVAPEVEKQNIWWKDACYFGEIIWMQPDDAEQRAA